MMGFQVFFLGFLFYEVAWSIIQRISVFVMNNLTTQNGIVRVMMIPNIVRAVHITALVYSWMLCAFFWGNPNEKIFLATISAAGLPTSLKSRMVWPAQSYATFDFFRHAARCFVGARSATKLWWFILRMNASEFSFTNRATLCSFHTGIVA